MGNHSNLSILAFVSRTATTLVTTCLLLLACSVPAAPQQPFAGRNLGGGDACKATETEEKKTDKKKAAALVDKKSSAKDDEEEEDEEANCDEKPATAKGSGTAAAIANGIVTPITAAQPLPPAGQLPSQQLPGTQPMAQTVTYSGGVSAYLSRACTSCHGGGFFGKSPNLSNYEAAKAGAAASLASMKAGRMPTSGKPADADIKLIESWIQGGMAQ
ncbi:MAG: hypothetical protein FJ146_11320 [Deltaproteobacteria bacterium]|nr:hypothetical protein [Deltaproteobacteria bacterium]